MPGHHFISYSRADGERFALRLEEELTAGPPSIPVWLDRRRLRAGTDWDEQLVDALRDCEGLLLVMTRDSVSPNSECKKEWSRALKYKKPVIPLLFHGDAELPYRLEPREYIDFTRGFDEGIARLRRDLDRRGSPEGVLRALQERLDDAKRDRARAADGAETLRIEDEISLLEQQVAQQRKRILEPEDFERRVTNSIRQGLELEREPSEPVKAKARTRFINPPPMVAPSYFQDRHVETGLVGAFLQDDALRIMTVVGRGGVGKTAMVCRILKALEGGHLPDEGGPLHVDGIVYLSAAGAHRVNFPNVFADLAALLPEDKAKRLHLVYQEGKISARSKVFSLLAEFPGGRTVLMLDNFEDVVDGQSLAIKDSELDEALRAVLEAPPHGVKVLITTRVAPRELLLAHPGLQSRLDLDAGLPSPHAEEVLRARDPDGKLGLKDARQELLAEARARTLGYPRALEAFAGILSADRDTTFNDLLDDLRRLQPRAQNVVEVLVGEAYSRLDPAAQRVMQALAVYGIPVPLVAVDYLLQPHRLGIDIASVLSRLVNMQFVRRDSGRYYLHQVDRDYACSRIPRGGPSDAGAAVPEFTLFALRGRGAEFFKDARKPREAWRSLEDLGAQLAEFDLRVAGENHDVAAELLSGVSETIHDWGHYRVLVDLHDRLRGGLKDAAWRIWALADRASASYRMGDYEEAVRSASDALSLARQQGDGGSEANALATLTCCFNETGEFQKALDCSEQGLSTAARIGSRLLELSHLNNRANTFSDLGRLEEAIVLYEQARSLASELGDRREECLYLANLAGAHGNLKDFDRKKSYAERAGAMARQVGFKLIEVAAACHLAEVAVFRNSLKDAASLFEEAMRQADEMENAQFQLHTRLALTRALLQGGDVARAWSLVEGTAALVPRLPAAHAGAVAFRGLVAARRGDRAGAASAFDEAVSVADAALAKGLPPWGAAYAKALALAGLALSRDAGLAYAAAEAYRTARGISSAAGIVHGALIDLDLLAAADEAGRLAPVRAAAAGDGRYAPAVDDARPRAPDGPSPALAR